MEYTKQDPEMDIEGALLIMEPRGPRLFQIDVEVALRLARLPVPRWDIKWAHYRPEVSDVDGVPQICLRLISLEHVPEKPVRVRRKQDPITIALGLDKEPRTRQKRGGRAKKGGGGSGKTDPGPPDEIES
eukprot:9470498-Pyramimonas_sp.AAC.1